MKRVGVIFIVIMCILFINVIYAAEVEVQINGEMIHFDDATAQIINSRTMVPFRKIFNELGVSDENITWDSDTKTIIAKNDDTSIQLQIGSPNAKKIVGDQISTITLDSEPVIINNRTLVPLRFIAESLGKTVGWDAANKTAIIIDFNYFLDAIRNKSDGIYQFLQTESSKRDISITRIYTDGDDNSKNNTATITARITENKNGADWQQNAQIIFSGNHELMQEIASEGWSDIQLENHYYEDYFTTKALTEGMKKVYGQEQLKFKYEGLNCTGKNTDTITDLIKNICDVDNTPIQVSTFQAIKTEFDTLLKKCNTNGNGGISTGNISSDSVELIKFDLTKLDNVLYNSPFNRVYSLLNSQIFHFDVKWDELRYDYPRMNITINANSEEMNIDFVLSNDYNEKVEYKIQINK